MSSERIEVTPPVATDKLPGNNSELMRPYHQTNEAKLAFIVNYEIDSKVTTLLETNGKDEPNPTSPPNAIDNFKDDKKNMLNTTKLIEEKIIACSTTQPIDANTNVYVFKPS